MSVYLSDSLHSHLPCPWTLTLGGKRWGRHSRRAGGVFIYPTLESAKTLLIQSSRQKLHLHHEMKKRGPNFQNTGDIEMRVYLSDTGITITITITIITSIFIINIIIIIYMTHSFCVGFIHSIDNLCLLWCSYVMLLKVSLYTCYAIFFLCYVMILKVSLYIYVYIYIYIYIYMCVYIYIYYNIYIYIYTYIQIAIRAARDAPPHGEWLQHQDALLLPLPRRRSLSLSVYVYTRIHVCMCICVYIYIYRYVV